MKIKTVSRSAKKEARDTSDHKYVRRNLDPSQHPFAAAREHQRAVVAAKLDRMMAKPFVCAMDGHRDALTCLGVPRRGQVHYMRDKERGVVWEDCPCTDA